MPASPRLPLDAVEQIGALRRRVTHLETRGVDWYRDAAGALWTSWVELVPPAPGWGPVGSDFPGNHLHWRIAADRVSFMGLVKCLVTNADPVLTLPGDARPASDQVVYWKFYSALSGGAPQPNERIVGSVDVDGNLRCPGAVAGGNYLIGDVSYPALELP